MNVRDRSNGSFPGSITRHGCDHLGTSDRVVASDFGSITGEGPTQGMPHIPGNPVPEVAIVNGDAEPCSASGVDDKGSVTQGDPAEKCASVSTHPGLMSSHRHSSITHEDHKAMHSGVEGTKKLEKPMDGTPGNFTPVAQKAVFSSTPATYQGGRQPFSNNSMRLSGLPSKAVEPTSPIISRVGKDGVVTGPAVYNSDTGKFGSV
jgi:hypothetical protein